MKATLMIEVEFDNDKTDIESLASAADTLLQTALSTPGVLADYGNARFGEFDVAESALHRDGFEQEFGTEESCPQHDGGHAPDWTSVHVEFDGNAYVDVACKHCGRSGCVGPEEKLTSEISW